jgi:hypothetical protein
VTVLLPLGTLDQLREHGSDAVGHVLRRYNLLDGRQLVDLNTVEGNYQLFRFSECYFVRGPSRSAALAHAFANIERHASGRTAHLTAKISFATRESSNDATDSSIQLKSASIDVKFVQFVSAPSDHAYTSIPLHVTELRDRDRDRTP